jgi:hypothetical protein
MTKDEVIETKAAWGKTFVEIVDPTKENHVFRAYFEQPQREWVDLTDKEIRALAKPSGDIEIAMTGRMWIFVGDLMTKLKEKNNG